MGKEEIMIQLNEIKKKLGIFPCDEAFCRKKNKTLLLLMSFFTKNNEEIILNYLLSRVSKKTSISLKNWELNLLFITSIEDNFTKNLKNYLNP